MPTAAELGLSPGDKVMFPNKHDDSLIRGNMITRTVVFVDASHVILTPPVPELPVRAFNPEDQTLRNVVDLDGYLCLTVDGKKENPVTPPEIPVSTIHAGYILFERAK